MADPKPKKPYVRWQDLSGKQFGRLTVLGAADRNGCKDDRTRWHCQCSCGALCVVGGKNLRSGTTSSCGCLRREVAKRAASLLNAGKQPAEGRKKRSPEYSTWRAMSDRCANRKHHAWGNYGGRGIKVCERWQGADGFANFLADMGPRPQGTEIDRFPDNDGDYEPGNCRWATRKEQARNRRTNRLITHNGETHCLADWSKITGLKRTAIGERLRRGWSVADALSAPESPFPRHSSDL